MDKEKEMFPIMLDVGRDYIPWGVLSEEMAMKNHSQTLQRLAQRGGLGPQEALMVILNLRWCTSAEFPKEEESLKALHVVVKLIQENRYH